MLAEVKSIDDIPVLSVVNARKCLGVNSRTTFNRDRKAIGLHRSHFTDAELVELFTLRLWLSARPGINSREAFKRYRQSPALLNVMFHKWGINLDHRIQEFLERLHDHTH